MNKVTIKYTGKLCPINQRMIISQYVAKATKRPFMILNPKYRNAKEALAWIAKSQCPQIVFCKGSNLSFSIIFEYPDCRVDSDAFLKIAKDALNGIVYEDDRQVSEDHTKRIINKSGQAFCTIIIEELTDSQMPLI